MKKLLALLLAISMLFALAACGASDIAEEAASAAQEIQSAAEEAADEAVSAATAAAAEVVEAAEEILEGSAEEASAEEPAAEPEAKDLETVEQEAMDVEFPLPLTDSGETLTFWGSYPPFVTNYIKYEEKQTYVEAEKATGVHLEINGVSLFDASTAFNLMVASGDYEDIIAGFGMQYQGGYDEAIDQGILIDIAPLLEENAPNYNYLLENWPEIAKCCYTDEGHMGEFFYINDSNSAIRGGQVIRGDMLKDVGMEAPTTYEEMEQVLAAFRDQLSIEAPYWINSSGLLEEQMAGFGISDGFYQVDGEVRYGFAQDEFLDYLTLMHDWYEKGLLYHDFMSAAANQQFPPDDMVNANQCGIFYESLNQFKAYDEVTSGDPDFEIDGLAYQTVEKGDITHFSSESTTVYAGMGYTITTDCDNPELAAKWCNYWFTREGSLLANYGVEGVSFEYVNGKPQFTDLVANNPDGLSFDVSISLYTNFNENAYICDNTKTDAFYTKAQLEASHIWADSSDTAYVYSDFAALTTEEGEVFNAYNMDMQTYVEEMALKFIVGDTDLSEFEGFRANLDNMGLEDCLAVKQAALDRFNERGQ